MGGGAINDNYDNLAGNGEFGTDAVLEALAEDIAAQAFDAEEAVEMCRDIARAEELDEDHFLALLAKIEAVTGWVLTDDA